MIVNQKFYLFILIFISLNACKNPGCTDIEANNYNSDANKNDNSCTYDANFKIEFKAVNGNQTFSKYDTLFFQNNAFRLENMKFYVSNIKLHSISDSIVISDIHLFNIDNNATSSLNLDVPEGNYSSISFCLGLSAEQNSTTPADYSTDHPLGINQNMFWAMTPASYIFALIEGKMDTLQTGFFPLTYHLAHNDLIRNIELDKEMNIFKENTNSIIINTDISQLFNSVNLSVDLPHQSTNSKLAQLLINNFSSSFEVQ